MSQSKEEHNNNNSNNQNLTVLDRSVSIVLEHPDETASSSREPPQPIIITPDTERLHRLHGTSLILEASHFLSLGASTFATACTIFHRFFHQRSLTEYSAWSVAMASTLLATKVEEEPQQITLKTLIQVFSHLYRKRILVAYNDITNDIDKGSSGSFWEHASLAYQKDVAQTWTLEEKHQTLEQLPLPSNKYGPVYQEWHKHIFEMEAIVLRQLGFTLYWIPDSHPHKFILYFCRVLELTDAKFSQRAWNYCNDSCRLDLCVRFEAEVIASSSILLAARDFSVELPTSPRPWWEIFVGKDKTKEIVTAANTILGLVETSTTSLDSLVASRGFVKSLVRGGGSFNDPGSFLWDANIIASSSKA